MSRLGLLAFISLFVVFSTQAPAASKENKKSSLKAHSINSIVTSKQLRISKKERRLANNIAAVYKVSQKGYLNKRNIKRLLKDLNKNKTFYIYKDWITDLNKISTYKSLSGIKRLCEKINNKKTTNPISSKLIYNSKQLCFQKYLDKLAQSNHSYKRLRNEVKYFSKYVSQYLTRNNIGELKYLLSKYKASPSRSKLLSNSLTKYFLDNSEVPNKNLLQHMTINHELTKFIQQTGLESNSTQQIIFAEFKKLVENAYKAADDNDDLRVINGKVKKAVNYYSLSSSHLPQSKSALKLVGLGKSLMRRSYFEPSRLIFKTVINNSSEYKNDALYELLWTYITQEDYDDAYAKVIKKYSLHKNFTEHTRSKLKFWTAYTLKEESEDNFDKILMNIIETDPVSYYSIISSKLLQESSKISSNRAYLNLLNKNQKTRIFTNLKIDHYTYRSLKRLKLWSMIDFKPFISSESRALNNIYSKEIIRLNPSEEANEVKDFVAFLSAKVLSSTDNHLEVFKVVYRGINNKVLKLDDDVLNLLYPMPYWDKIKRYSKVDPIIPLSLIRQESAFNKRARSHVGARGLMQLMPYTARMFRRRVRKTQLYNPNINLKIGNQYFANLMKRYDQNLVYSLSAYNAGEGRVKRWRNRYLTSDSILHNVENIPFSETRKYVKLIFRNIFFYKLMNDEKAKTNLADSSKPNKIFDVYLGFNN